MVKFKMSAKLAGSRIYHVSASLQVCLKNFKKPPYSKHEVTTGSKYSYSAINTEFILFKEILPCLFNHIFQNILVTFVPWWRSLIYVLGYDNTFLLLQNVLYIMTFQSTITNAEMHAFTSFTARTYIWMVGEVHRLRRRQNRTEVHDAWNGALTIEERTGKFCSDAVIHKSSKHPWDNTWC